MDETTETMTISNRSDFALWAIERAKATVAEEGGNLAISTLDQSDDEIAASANALGQAIVNALLEVFDGLMQEYGARLPFGSVPVVAALALLFRLPKDLLALLVLGSLRRTGLLPCRARSAAGGNCMLLGGNRRIDGCRRWLALDARLIDTRRRRRTPCSRCVVDRAHLLHLDVTTLLFEQRGDFLAHLLDGLTLRAAVDHRLQAVHGLVRPRDALVELFQR